jgi:hypothetical protein
VTERNEKQLRQHLEIACHVKAELPLWKANLSVRKYFIEASSTFVGASVPRYRDQLSEEEDSRNTSFLAIGTSVLAVHIRGRITRYWYSYSVWDDQMVPVTVTSTTHVSSILLWLWHTRLGPSLTNSVGFHTHLPNTPTPTPPRPHFLRNSEQPTQRFTKLHSNHRS